MLRTWPVRFPAIELTESVEIFPRASDARYVRLVHPIDLLLADFARHASYFTGEAVQLIHHGVESFLQL